MGLCVNQMVRAGPAEAGWITRPAGHRLLKVGQLFRRLLIKRATTLLRVVDHEHLLLTANSAGATFGIIIILNFER